MGYSTLAPSPLYYRLCIYQGKLRVRLIEILCLFRCVIGELFTDGRQLFDLSQLLELRARHGEYSPEILLKKMDKPVRVSPSPAWPLLLSQRGSTIARLQNVLYGEYRGTSLNRTPLGQIKVS